MDKTEYHEDETFSPLHLTSFFKHQLKVKLGFREKGIILRNLAKDGWTLRIYVMEKELKDKQVCVLIFSDYISGGMQSGRIFMV